MWKPFVLALGGAMAAGAGCVDDAPSVMTTDDLIQRHGQGGFIPNGVPIPNASGYSTTDSSAGKLDITGPFFQNLGANGRRCVTCHLPTAGWTIVPEQVQVVFNLTSGGTVDDGYGLGAIFRLNDGAVAPNADVSTLAKRRQAYSMLLDHGLIRVGIGVPAGAEFSLIAVDDPYGYASAADLSLFRRPLPSTNLKFLSTVMWDGRETFRAETGACPNGFTDAQGRQFCTIGFDLADQSNGATQGHAQAPNPIDSATRAAIVDFEENIVTAQVVDYKVGRLDADGATGTEDPILSQTAYVGINDLFGDSHTGAPFNPIVFDLYDAWTGTSNSNRAAIWRGQALFNTRNIDITGVGGINDSPDFGSPAVVHGTCTVCHDTPNGGNHSVPAPLNIGLVDASRRTPDMPLYTFRNNATGATVQVTDPGRALITGKWADMGKFKGPILRGLAARAPYFHNGSANNLDEVVDFYNDRFNMHLTSQEHSDLVAFLRTL